MKRLAAENGIDPDDVAAVRKFDRHRPGKGSNQEWLNPYDPDAKIGRTKDGATDMIYKPEAVVDLDTGAIVQAQVRTGDQADHKEMATRVLEAQQKINQAAGEELDTLTVNTVTSDKGYYAVNELHALQQEDIRTVMADPMDHRRLDKLEPDQKKAVQAARRSVKSKSGKRPVAPARHAYRKELRAYSGLRRNEADNFAGMGKPEQALQAGGRVLQSVATHAEALRNWNAQATRRLRAAAFSPIHLPFDRPGPNRSTRTPVSAATQKIFPITAP